MYMNMKYYPILHLNTN